MKFLFLFSSKSLIVLCFTFLSVISFELIFYMAKVRVNFIFFFYEDIQFSHHHLLDYSFLIEMSWHILLVFMTCKTYWREVKEIAEKFLDESWTVIIHSSYSVLCLSQAWSHLIFTKPPGGTLWLFSFYTQRSQGLERLRSLPEGLLLRTSGAGLEIHVHPTPALLGTIIGSCQK